MAPSRTPSADGHVDVLVVGAGPVGISLAIELTRRGHDVQIIDSLSAPAPESRAIIVHSRTLDHFEALGVLPDIMDRAVLSTGLEMHTPRDTVVVSFEHIRAVHPYSVSLVQSDTEAVLTRRLQELGVAVKRPHTLLAYSEHDDGVTATIRDGDGTGYDLDATFLVGSDGARSTVRQLMKQNLEGSFHGDDVVLADVEGDHEYDTRHFHTFFSAGETSGMLFPLAGHRLRAFAQLPPGVDPEHPLTTDWVQHLLDERDMKIAITETHWLNRFTLKHGLVPQYRMGRAFLAGDAAHIHSPAGGLGMNTGIQDAVNLAWKLAHGLGGRADDRLLDSYHDERHPVGAGLVSLTTRLTSVATAHHPAAQHARNALLHLGMHLPETVIDQLGETIEQQHVGYRHSPVVTGHERRHGLSPGDYLYVPGTTVAAGLGATTGHLVLLLAEAQDATVPVDPLGGLPVLAISAAGRSALRDATGLEAGAVVVRPDGYVGAIGADPERTVTDYLRQLDGSDPTGAP